MFFVPKSEINISKKIPLFGDNFDKIVWKSRFLPIYQTYIHISRKGTFFEKISTYRRKRHFLRSLHFLSINSHYQHFEENNITFRSVWKSIFSAIYPKITTFWRSFLKIVFCQYLRIYQHFGVKHVIVVMWHTVK